jgi:Ca2+-binding RTX toxin-like protein
MLFMKLRALLVLATMVLGGMLLSGVVLAVTKHCDHDCKGTNGRDRLIGSGSTNTLSGLGGPDTLKGLRRGDLLNGAGGDDDLFGGAGDDDIFGGPGTDRLHGKKKDDYLKDIESFAPSSAARHKQRIEAAKARTVDVLIGDRGNDIMKANDGKRDIIRGGPGHDTAYVDRVDKVKGVEEPVVPGGPGPNKTPVAKDDSYLQPGCGNQSGYLRVGSPGVLGNDTDADNQGNTNFGLTVKDANPNTPEIDPASGPSNATLTLNADGSFIYEATDGIAHPASFTYKVTDGAADSNEAKVTIGVDNSSCEP